jgi:hypothetical protein
MTGVLRIALFLLAIVAAVVTQWLTASMVDALVWAE